MKTPEEVRMLSNESLFRLFSVALLGILFISVTAVADKENDSVSKTLFSTVQHIEEAEQINNGQIHAMHLTSVGDRIEIITPREQTPTPKK